jgi:hypothetical protein
MQERFAGDFNGDGKLDIGAIYNASNGAKIYVYLSDGTQLTGPSMWCQASMGAYTNFFVGDFNGDGKTDICFMKRGGAKYTEEYQVSLSTGSGFQQPVFWFGWNSPDAGSGTGRTRFDSIFADVNGDGLPDMIKPEHINTGGAYGTHRYWVYLSTGISFSSPSIWLSDTGTDTGYWPVIGDFNGDGLTDMVDSNSISKKWDILVTRSSGLYFTPRDKWGEFSGNGTGTLYLNAFIGGDFDHNGISDFGLFYAYGVSGPRGLQIWNSNTLTFSNISTILSGDQYTGASFIGDLDGDGIDDYGKYSTQYWLHRDFVVKKGLGKPADLLTGVTNSLGGSISITYKPSTQYDNTAGSGVSNLPFVVQTVDSITSNDGIGNVYTTYYSHQNGFYSTAEREFRGFGYSKVTYPDSTTHETWYYQDDVFKGKPYKEEIKDASGNLYHKTEYT